MKQMLGVTMKCKIESYFTKIKLEKWMRIRVKMDGKGSTFSVYKDEKQREKANRNVWWSIKVRDAHLTDEIIIQFTTLLKMYCDRRLFYTLSLSLCLSHCRSSTHTKWRTRTDIGHHLHCKRFTMYNFGQ